MISTRKTTHPTFLSWAYLPAISSDILTSASGWDEQQYPAHMLYPALQCNDLCCFPPFSPLSFFQPEKSLLILLFLIWNNYIWASSLPIFNVSFLLPYTLLEIQRRQHYFHFVLYSHPNILSVLYTTTMLILNKTICYNFFLSDNTVQDSLHIEIHLM